MQRIKVNANSDLNLLSNDRKHVHLDAIELVEAGPRARLCQTLEELGHGVEVDAVRAVENHALLSHSFGQILLG